MRYRRVHRFIENTAKLLLSPLLTWQALKVRKSARVLPEPPGHRSGVFGQGPALNLLLTGDSSAAGVGAPTQHQALSGQLAQALGVSYTVHWHLIARTGNTTRSTLPLLKSQTPEYVDVALVVLGVNDITTQTPLRNLLRCRAELYRHLREDWGAKRVIVAGIPPLGAFPLLPQPLRWFLGLQARRFDRALAQQAAELRVDYMPFDVPMTPEMWAEDGFHPGPNTYQLMGERVAAQIMHQ
ncbi:SGNH/GDSL hydrolase family protein [Aliiroseovarius crassostreae]|uniref:SGNH/GDSL hydrolase family protein n=1 Tax=Aliiroseovarius crassostreae TaxID=154981 RepID=A0A9Q9HC64_9RHOB|nr:SGNH/GDSL hydrolase family protein [Aliiroseovarius crassostreae]UWP92632.1 SGNH/GDSL hydrolase family protein [Aliiroseovarius crassostreae]UWP95772.1 SGNH/GDSL hydrolase family protein [Aliiroseovarius crassostreae]